jgi:hypothetical protein
LIRFGDVWKPGGFTLTLDHEQGFKLAHSMLSCAQHLS